MTQAEAAKKHRVTPGLVNRLIRESKKEPEKLRNRKQKEKEAIEVNTAVIATASALLEKSIPIEKA